MNLYGQFNKLTKEQRAELCHIALLATALRNNKLWRKYWVTKKDYLSLYHGKAQCKQ